LRKGGEASLAMDSQRCNSSASQESYFLCPFIKSPTNLSSYK
jgi:hypothetical protein